MAEVALGSFHLRVAEGHGPRILGLRRTDGPQLFADLGNLTLPHPQEPYLLGGGHRLWIGPEVPDVTYWPETGTVHADPGPPLVVTGPERGPVAKVITVEPVEDALLVTHAVTNRTGRSLLLAPWAITQLLPGGEVLLPVGIEGNGFQAENVLVTWPYTDLGDPGLSIAGTTAKLSGTRSTPIKVGSPVEGRAVAQLREGWVFAKASPPTDGPHMDRGATGQIYVNDAFVELETVGPLVDLAAGASVEHVEVWRVFPFDGTAEELSARLDELGWPP